MINIAKKAAISAGKILVENFDKFKEVQEKEGGLKNLVSHVDFLSEEKIIKILKKHFPSHGILAEESGTHENQSDFTWVIDPLDGTSNYLQGIPHFAISIALVEKSQPILGVVYDPIKNEMFWVEEGKKAYLNDKPIYVSKVKEIQKAFANVGWTHKEEKSGLSTFSKMGRISRKIRALGSAALDFCYLANARYDLVISHGLNFWDVAAASLIAQQAGAVVLDENSEKIQLNKPFTRIIAANKNLYKEIIKLKI